MFPVDRPTASIQRSFNRTKRAKNASKPTSLRGPFTDGRMSCHGWQHYPPAAGCNQYCDSRRTFPEWGLRYLLLLLPGRGPYVAGWAQSLGHRPELLLRTQPYCSRTVNYRKLQLQRTAGSLSFLPLSRTTPKPTDIRVAIRPGRKPTPHARTATKYESQLL
jgi:hypothetical protein